MRGARVMPLRAAKQSRGLVPACAAAFCAAKRIGLRVQEILPLGALSGAPSVEVRYGSTRCLVNDGAAQVAPVRSGHHPTRGSKPCRDDADNKCFDFRVDRRAARQRTGSSASCSPDWSATMIIAPRAGSFGSGCSGISDAQTPRRSGQRHRSRSEPDRFLHHWSGCRHSA